MANYKPGGNKSNISILVVTGIFLLVGIVLIVWANFNSIMSWMRVSGIALLVIMAPIMASIIYKMIKDKVNKI